METNQTLQDKFDELQKLFNTNQYYMNIFPVNNALSELEQIETRLVYHTTSPVENEQYAKLERSIKRDPESAELSHNAVFGVIRYY